ncbi:nuclear transport factor 2 family protein [Mycobacterium sp. ACS4331]|uniref:nuclear transport factor 2 family protein n=1 Tax=Mycobacterium sp. ACS4331 TaxID=1834121 RepID=UPI0007FC7F95|nr:nuclear transport factor 2 family protein [Mycobacterium sp. ACS4331]OBF15139.1 hypothetical protein A5727_15180 [Mycobacterium sp. ACS4331]
MSNVDTARAAYNAFNTGDLATLKDMWADDIHWWNSDAVKPGGEKNGVDAVMQMMMEVPEHWSSLKVEPTKFIEAGDYVVVLGTEHLTNDKGTADARFAHVLKFDGNGKCVESEMHADTAPAAKLQG